MPIGVAAAITRLEFNSEMLLYELPFLFVLTFVVLMFLFGRSGIQKRHAITIIAMYVAYATLRVGEAV